MSRRPLAGSTSALSRASSPWPKPCATPWFRAASGSGPLLCLAAAEALDVPRDHALPAALALELVHAFSLVHDDLPALDDDAVRRGQPATHHVRFGEDVAILAGDALLNEAFALLAAPGPAPAVRRLAALATVARAVGPAGMIGGQYLDLTSAGDIDEAGLRRLDRLKTGALFEAAVGCAVALADPPPERAAALEAYGAELGLLYQIVDDLLDATGSEGHRAGPPAATSGPGAHPRHGPGRGALPLPGAGRAGAGPGRPRPPRRGRRHLERPGGRGRLARPVAAHLPVPRSG